jgi:hypothetical protein
VLLIGVATRLLVNVMMMRDSMVPAFWSLAATNRAS